tara:strand:- start:1815 stop:2702 length:888 start_codon:yes stop_codon:yes gene_type:complete
MAKNTDDSVSTIIPRSYQGLSARFTSNYGAGNQFTTKSYYRYFQGQSDSFALGQAKDRFVKNLKEQGYRVGDYIRSPAHINGEYGQVLLSSVSLRVVFVGLIEITAVFTGEENFASSASADTIMIYTAGDINQQGIPSSRLINQIGDETPDAINLDAHVGGDALTRAPFTRSVILYTPTVIDSNGPYAMGWQFLIGKTNTNGFNVPFGRDGEYQTYLSNRVRFDGFSTEPKPLCESSGGVAWKTKFQFSICSTEWVQQAVETFEKTDENDQPILVGRIIYEDSYQRDFFPTLYST